ncbi:hypothetical protein B0T17DRAFT_526460 [Bombardia bombarda]|uniref:RRN7-type domain-containing protein n=1 Tax=Bombardia bombarda TaxID=252184 RepID=A0AA39X9G0_9PEZI|nr:hypothetical protein B0T17DRAFT_526460 [Bombardia bombarda]
MAGRRHHRFPRGETCDDCPARRWYIENGHKFCENGHQVEGYVQFDIDVDDNFGKSGKVIRKKKETKKGEVKQLSGKKAKELYMMCQQVILRKQIAWLISEKGISNELDGVCRDLWDFRTCKFIGLTMVGNKVGDRKGKANATKQGSQSQPDSGSERPLHSSQGEEAQSSSDGEALGRTKLQSKIKSWASEKWEMPRMVDLLALLYLGCLLIQEPVRIGDIYRWAMNNQLPFIGAIKIIPKEIRERLPPWAHKSLHTRYFKFEGTKLHNAVKILMLGYRKNYGLIFPAIPDPPLLLRYIKDLAIPPEVYVYAQKLWSLLGFRLSFPTSKPKNSPLDSDRISKYPLLDVPDVLLVVAIVVATKSMFPFDGIERQPLSIDDPLTLKMNWDIWEAEFADTIDDKLPNHLIFENMDPQRIWTMSDEEKNEYLDWYQETQLDDEETLRERETDIDRLFPLQPISRPAKTAAKVGDEDEKTILARLQRVLKATEFVPPLETNRSDGNGPQSVKVKTLGDDYPHYRTVEELKGTAKQFYQVAAKLSGLSLNDLVVTVISFEMKLLSWQRAEELRIQKSTQGPIPSAQ